MHSDSKTWAVRPPSTSSSSRTSISSRFQATLSFRRRPSSDLDNAHVPLHESQQPTLMPETAVRSSKGKQRAESELSRNHSTKPTFQWARGELIGRGSYGQVYLALNATTGEIIAVKQVEIAQPKSDARRLQEVVEALKLEKDTLKHLDHPHVVRFLGFEENHRCLSIFMEYVSGGTITSCLVENGPFEPELTKHFTRQILEGLGYLHGRGIIHRDLKADNILVEKSGACKISDFGISKHADDAEGGRAFTGMRGTVFWMAPEVLDPKECGYDSKIDIWSIGCVVLEMWTANRPWHNEALFPVLMKVSREKRAPPLPSNMKLSEEAEDFRQKCFIVDPVIRPSAVELQRHPYLVQRLDWSFLTSRFVTKSKKRASSAHPASQRTARPATAHRKPQAPRREDTNPPPLPNPHPADPPPLVIITPPGSPTRGAPPDFTVDLASFRRKTSASDSGSTKGKRRPRISFFVANPDVVGPSKSYVYTPPPLPDVNRRTTSSRFSTHPTIKDQLFAPGHSPDTLHPNPNHTIRSVKSLSSMQSSTWDSDYDTDMGTSYWKKPPINLRPADQNKRLSRAGADPALERPKMEEIVDNLEEWFPDYDVDKPIVQESNLDANVAPVRPAKSIRRVAEEQVRRLHHDPDNDKLQRRGTKIWGSSPVALLTRLDIPESS